MVEHIFNLRHRKSSIFISHLSEKIKFIYFNVNILLVALAIERLYKEQLTSWKVNRKVSQLCQSKK